MMKTDIFGWMVLGFTLLAFLQHSMLPLRLAAIAADLAFIAYGLASELPPILALHLVLLPRNFLRLAQQLSRQRRSTATSEWSRGNRPHASQLVPAEAAKPRSSAE